MRFPEGREACELLQGAKSSLYVQRSTLALPRNRRVAVYVARQTFASRWERGRGDGRGSGLSSERRGPCIQFVSFLGILERSEQLGKRLTLTRKKITGMRSAMPRQ
jgi:hypothetical protein